MSRDIFSTSSFLRAPSNMALNTFKDRSTTASRGKLFQCFIPFIIKKFFLISNQNLPSSGLKPNCSDASPKKQGNPSIALLLFSCFRGWLGKLPKESADNLARCPRAECCLLRSLLLPWGSAHSTAVRAPQPGFSRQRCLLLGLQQKHWLGASAQLYSTSSSAGSGGRRVSGVFIRRS